MSQIYRQGEVSFHVPHLADSTQTDIKLDQKGGAVWHF